MTQLKRKKLKVGILVFKATRVRGSKDALMLKNAGLARGHRTRIYFANHFHYSLENSKLQLFYRNKRFVLPDIMIVRADIVTDIDLDLCLVKHMQLMGVTMFNSSISIARAKNKIRTLQILTHHKIAVPKTVVISNINYLDKAIDELGKFPMIVKLARGTFGSGVCLIESRRSLRSVLDLIIASNFSRNSHMLIQEYVGEAKGKDIRAFVIGKEVAASMERRAKKGEFRANVNQGGSTDTVVLSQEEIDISLQSAKVLGLDVAGVDIIRTATGPKILEVNANPGLEGITASSGKNIADLILQHAELKYEKRRKRGSRISVSHD